MWQEVVVYVILALAGGLTLWRFLQKFSGKSSCCGGGCTCSGSCGSAPKSPPKGDGCGLRMSPQPGGCGCSR